MIINEKGLCRLLKQEYKSIGYTIVQEGDLTILSADGIVVRMKSAFIPRQLLGLLVEHSGEFPAACSIQVMKGRENQIMLPQAAIDLDIHLENLIKAEHTVITLNGFLEVYQCKDKQSFGIRSGHLEVLENRGKGEIEPVVDLWKKVAAWYGENMEVFIPIWTKEENAHLAALESQKWTL